MPQETEDQGDRVDDVNVEPSEDQLRRLEEQREQEQQVHWILDLIGYDSGQFNPTDIWFDSGHVTITGGGISGAVPMGDEPGYIGVNVGLDVDITDGTVGLDVAGIGYDPSLDPGLQFNGTSVQYYIEIPSPTGGLSMYPVPGGEPGDYYWGPPPGSLGGDDGSF